MGEVRRRGESSHHEASGVVRVDLEAIAAAAMVRAGGTSAYVPSLAQIAAVHGADVVLCPGLMTGGAIACISGVWKIFLDGKGTAAEKRHVLAHEIGHHLLKLANAEPAGVAANERAANYIADLLVMPSKTFRRAVAANLTVDELASTFITDPCAVERRLARLGIRRPARAEARSLQAASD